MQADNHTRKGIHGSLGVKIESFSFWEVLGVYIGIEATTDRQYQAALEKLEKILEIFRGVKDKLTLALRIAYICSKYLPIKPLILSE